MTALLLLVLAVNLAVLVLLLFLLRRTEQSADPTAAVATIGTSMQSLERALSQSFAKATADMAQRLEQTKGDLRLDVTEKLTAGFKEMRGSVEDHLAAGRREQTEALTQSRRELSDSLVNTTSQLKKEFDALTQRTEQKLEAIRGQVDQKLMDISGQVQQKLTDNMKEGFAQFEKVQQHLKAAEEQLRQVGTIGNSINELNSLLKLPHLRGGLGEDLLNDLLEDFLPAHMYETQYALGGGRVDAVIKFPDHVLPIDSKFPREQILPLFESGDEAKLEEARSALVDVMRVQAKRISAYIDPQQGTLDVALMFLPSETLYFETIRSAPAREALNKLRVFPVSPNTLMMMLQTIKLAYGWYDVAARFEETRKEISKAQTSLQHFQKQFESVGKSLEKAQEAYETANRHLKTYTKRVGALSGEEALQPELELNDRPLLSKGEASGR
jgi:DNA recombination protein RmuC